MREVLLNVITLAETYELRTHGKTEGVPVTQRDLVGEGPKTWEKNEIFRVLNSLTSPEVLYAPIGSPINAPALFVAVSSVKSNMHTVTLGCFTARKANSRPGASASANMRNTCGTAANNGHSDFGLVLRIPIHDQHLAGTRGRSTRSVKNEQHTAGSLGQATEVLH